MLACPLNAVVPSSHAHGRGPPAHVPVLVPGRVPLPADLGGTSPASDAPLVPDLVLGPFGKAPAPEGGRTHPTTRMSGDGSPSPGIKAHPPDAGVGFSLPSPPLPSPGQRTYDPRPRLTLAHISDPSRPPLMNALA